MRSFAILSQRWTIIGFPFIILTFFAAGCLLIIGIYVLHICSLPLVLWQPPPVRSVQTVLHSLTRNVQADMVQLVCTPLKTQIEDIKNYNMIKTL